MSAIHGNQRTCVTGTLVFESESQFVAHNSALDKLKIVITERIVNLAVSPVHCLVLTGESTKTHIQLIAV